MSLEYPTHGCEVIPFLPQSRLEGMRQAIAERIDAAVAVSRIPLGSRFPEETLERRLQRIAGFDKALAEEVLMAVYSDAHKDERIAFLDGYAPLRAIAGNLVGKEIRSFTIRVRANVPGLPGRRQGWHSDVSILDGGEFARVKIACWLPLVDAHAGNGTLEVVPGIRAFPMAHEGGPAGHTIREEDLEGFGKRIVDCDAGNAVFLDAFVPHRALPNPGDEVRWSVVTWMMV
ncbi:MAG: hypothetical protein JWO30_1840 [Fibrobacteres bacterium]|nr:hypothetical protein [Fibrobacterota bacterium]